MTWGKKRKNDELGPNAAGQAGDTQQISSVADVDSESVEELVEEGNAFEANAQVLTNPINSWFVGNPEATVKRHATG
jgi:hypothetical protein